MLDRRRYGLQLQGVNKETHEMVWYTPRNLIVAFAMAEEHAATAMGPWLYKINTYGAGWATEPIMFDRDTLDDVRLELCRL